MSSDVAIKVQNLTKCYQIYENPTDRLKQFLISQLRRLIGRLPKKYFREFWALQEIAFEIKKGETVGIVGKNGAGKSTLLQILCGTLSPSSGTVEINGRVAALLELGSGFNPEFTGRENIYMNAGILGLTYPEIDARFAEIVTFADIGDFIDQPVKTYSSGMFVRLAFAVIVHVNPDILIVDEALSVGDMYFQAKCMMKLKQMMRQGVTVLFVSHDTSTIRGLCQNCLFLEHGKMVKFGNASEVVDLYVGKENLQINQLLHSNNNLAEDFGCVIQNAESSPSQATIINSIRVSTSKETEWPATMTRYGDGRATIFDVQLLDIFRRPIEEIAAGDEFVIQISVCFNSAMPTFALGYSIRDLKGQMLVGSVTTCENMMLPAVNPGEIYVFEISSTNKLTAGVYSISIGVEFPIVLNQQHIFLDVVEHVRVFKSYLPADTGLWFPSLVKVPSRFNFISFQ